MAHLAVLTANVIYGVNFTIAKGVMPEHLEPLGFTALRVIGAGGLFWLMALFGNYERVERKDMLALFVASLFGVCINQVSFFEGLSITGPINAAIILTSVPIIVLLTSSVVLGNRISIQKIVGIAVGLTGAVLIITRGGGIDMSADTMIGDLLMLVNACSFSYYMVYVKRLMIKYEPETVVRWIFTFGWLTVVPLGMPQVFSAGWSGMPWTVYLSIGFVIVFTTFFTYLFINYGIKHAGPTVVSTYVYSQPIIASLVAVGFGKDVLDREKIVAGLLVFAGVYLVSAPDWVRKLLKTNVKAF